MEKGVADSDTEASVRPSSKGGAENLNKGEPVKDSMKNKRIHSMNEFAQTNMEKGVADSGAEALVRPSSKGGCVGVGWSRDSKQRRTCERFCEE